MHLLVVLLLASLAQAEDPDLARLFARRGLTGTLVLTSLDGSRTFIHNDARAAERFIAASTFKIPNTLIGIEEKAVDLDSRSPWDGVERPFPGHNRDQTLESAFQVSCLWCYQIIARRVGAAKYPEYIRRMAYGQLREPFDGTEFWLDGSLTISAQEQIAFLRNLVQRKLPFSPRSYDILARIMVADSPPGYTLRAKTGWSGGPHPQVGWYVGTVETPKEVWLFALNIVVRSPDDLPLRATLVREALTLKGILPK